YIRPGKRQKEISSAEQEILSKLYTYNGDNNKLPKEAVEEAYTALYQIDSSWTKKKVGDCWYDNVKRVRQKKEKDRKSSAS
ncbi:9192_t:CDS:1, partial [Paraglomus brasilianum]